MVNVIFKAIKEERNLQCAIVKIPLNVALQWLLLGNDLWFWKPKYKKILIDWGKGGKKLFLGSETPIYKERSKEKNTV